MYHFGAKAMSQNFWATHRSRLLSLMLLSLWLWLLFSWPAPAISKTSRPQVISFAATEQRLEAIAAEMESVRLCNRAGGCRYSDIQVHVSSTSDPTVPYLGTIDAGITRPADYPDKAHYNFEFREGAWHLLGGEEVSDVSSFFFNDDAYEVFSSYSGRTRVDKLSNARPGVRIGYKALYYRVMDHGLERL